MLSPGDDPEHSQFSPEEIAVVVAEAAAAAAVVDVHTESIRRAVAAGVRIAMGTDSGVGPHGRNLEELPLMAACGMTAAAVVAASTSAGARLLGLGQVTGRVAPGLVADLCVVGGPLSGDGGLDDLSARLRAVFRAGVPVSLG